MKVEGKVRQLVEMLLGKNSWMNIVIYTYVVIFEIKFLNYFLSVRVLKSSESFALVRS